jgi:hypothetical protein
VLRSASVDFDDEFGLDDIAFDLAYARTTAVYEAKVPQKTLFEQVLSSCFPV